MASARPAPRHVLHVMASGAHGGGADHLLGLLPALVAAGLHISAAVGDDGPLGPKLAAQGIAYRPLKVMGARLSGTAIAQLSACLATAADVVHFHGTRAAFLGSLAAALHRAKGRLRSRAGPRQRLAYTAHGLAFRQAGFRPRGVVLAAAEALICRTVDGVVSVSATDLALMRHWGWLRHRSTAYIANAVDLQRFQPASQSMAQSRLELSGRRYWVGTVSRLVPQKAVADLMDAVLPLGGEVGLLVVGAGPQRAALQSHPLALANRVRFLGARDDVADILPALDVFALSSRWEGEPIALLEAMACRLPCVATATPGAQEILRPPQLGRCVPIADVKALSATLRQLLGDPNLRRALGQAGCNAVAKRTYPHQAQQVLCFYRTLWGSM